jgi:hypothetical protein
LCNKPGVHKTSRIVMENFDSSKYDRMLKVGLPEGAVQQQMQKDSLEKSIIDMYFKSRLAANTVTSAAAASPGPSGKPAAADLAASAATGAAAASSVPPATPVAAATAAAAAKPAAAAPAKAPASAPAPGAAAARAVVPTLSPVKPTNEKLAAIMAAVDKFFGASDSSVKNAAVLDVCKQVLSGENLTLAGKQLNTLVEAEPAAPAARALVPVPVPVPVPASTSAIVHTETSAKTPVAASAADVPDVDVSKYEKMQKVGLPDGAVEQQMRKDGMTEVTIAKFFKRPLPASARIVVPRKTHATDAAAPATLTASAPAPAPATGIAPSAATPTTPASGAGAAATVVAASPRLVSETAAGAGSPAAPAAVELAEGAVPVSEAEAGAGAEAGVVGVAAEGAVPVAEAEAGAGAEAGVVGVAAEGAVPVAEAEAGAGAEAGVVGVAAEGAVPVAEAEAGAEAGADADGTAPPRRPATPPRASITTPAVSALAPTSAPSTVEFLYLPPAKLESIKETARTFDLQTYYQPLSIITNDEILLSDPRLGNKETILTENCKVIADGLLAATYILLTESNLDKISRAKLFFNFAEANLQKFKSLCHLENLNEDLLAMKTALRSNQDYKKQHRFLKQLLTETRTRKRPVRIEMLPEPHPVRIEVLQDALDTVD